MLCDILVTCATLKNRKAFFFSSEIVLLHQTVIKESLMFRWKILAPTFILTPFLLNLRKSLTHTFVLTSMFIRHLAVCKMIISLGTFFHFSKILIIWAKNGVNEQKWPKLAKSLSALYLRNNMWYDCGFWFLEHSYVNKGHHLKAFFKWLRGKVVKWQKVVPPF